MFNEWIAKQDFLHPKEERSKFRLALNITTIVLQVVIIILLVVDIKKRKEMAEDWDWDWDDEDEDEDEDFLYVTDEDYWDNEYVDDHLEEDTHRIANKIRHAENRLRNLRSRLPGETAEDVIYPADEKVVFEFDNSKETDTTDEEETKA